MQPVSHMHSSSRVCSSPLHWGYMVLYSTVTPRCFFSADDLRERLDDCPLPWWRDDVTTLLPLPSASSLSPVSSFGWWRGEEEERQKDGGEDDSSWDKIVFSVFWANTFCFFQVSSGWAGDKVNESWECDDVVLVCGLRSKSLRSLADSSRQSSLAKEADLFMRDGGVRPAWRIRASSSMALCHPVGSRKLFPSCLFLSRCPTSRRWEVCSELTPLQGPGSVSIASLRPWGCPSSCTSLSVTSKLIPSWRKACSSLSVCWILSSSWLPRASLIWALQPGPQPRFLPWELDSCTSSVSDSWTVTPSRVIWFEPAWGRVWHCRFWLGSWFCLWDWAEVSRDDSNSWLVEVSDDISIWLPVGVCVMIGIAPETWLIFESEEHEGSGSLSVPEEWSLWSSRCDPVCFSSSLDLAETAMISPWVSLCSVECRGEWSGGCSVLMEHRASLTGGCSVLGECSGDRWDTAISISCFSFCSSCLVARRTEPAGQSHGSMEEDCACEGGVKELCVTSEVSVSSWCSGWVSWGLWGDGDSDEEEEVEGVGRQEAGWHMASISVTIWRTDTPLSWWAWGVRSELTLSTLSSDCRDAWETRRETECISILSCVVVIVFLLLEVMTYYFIFTVLSVVSFSTLIRLLLNTE